MLLLFLAACGLTSSNGDDCQQLNQTIEDELDAVTSCETASECGQPIEGTGCTPECLAVARLDADTTVFSEALDGAISNQCTLSIELQCDCPPVVEGAFLCVDGTCDWDYGDFN